MKVKLINNPTLDFVDTGIGMCWGKGGYGAETEKGKSRIDRVCNKFHHASMLRFVQYIFEVELSTSALLEWSRHTTAVDLAVKSSRYCAKQDGDDMQVEYSRNDLVNAMLYSHMNEIKQLIKDHPSVGNDDLKILLPQGFIYTMQVQFNAQSLQHFLFLRSDKTAHYHIRDLSHALYDSIPLDHQYLFEAHIKEGV